jgi:folate-binding protein YgfZ
MTDLLTSTARPVVAGGRPRDYGDPAGEERALVEGGGLADVSDVEWVAVTGADRARFLQGIVTNEVASLRPGEGCRAAWLTAKARVQMLMAVLVEEERLLLRLPPGQAEAFVAAIDRYVIMEDVTFVPLPRGVGLAVEGPQALAVVAAATGLGPARLAQMAAAPGTLDHLEVNLPGGARARLVSHSVGPGGGFELWVDEPRAGEALWDALSAAGEGRGLLPVGDEAREAARIAAGTLAFGVDVDAETFFPELPMTGWVSFKKGCYVGQEPVARVHFRGRPVRQVAGVVLAADTPTPPPRAAVFSPGEDREVGRVSSLAFSHRLGRPIGLGLLRQEVLEPGTRLEIASGDERLGAVVHAFPIGP